MWVKLGSVPALKACPFYPPTADIGAPTAQVRFVPTTEVDLSDPIRNARHTCA